MFNRKATRGEGFLEVLGNNCGVGLWDAILVDEDAMHPKSQWTWTNEFRRLLGFRDESDFPNVCRSWSDRLHPDDAARVFAAFNGALKKTSSRSYDVTYRLKLADGNHRWFRATGGVVHNASGKAVRACGSLIDINDLTIASDAARGRAETLGTLTNAFDREMSALTATVTEATARFETTARQLAESAAGTSARTAAVSAAAEKAGRERRGGRRRGGGTRLLGFGNPPSGGAFDGNVTGSGATRPTRRRRSCPNSARSRAASGRW